MRHHEIGVKGEKRENDKKKGRKTVEAKADWTRAASRLEERPISQISLFSCFSVL